jgi:DNA-binding ferritin-like protein (Dps family)
MIAEKRHYRAYRRRKAQLPTDYLAVLDAVERYVLHSGWVKGDTLLLLLDDLADLMEEAAASRTPIHDLVGDDPVEFTEGFMRNYPDSLWIDKERARLTDAIASVRAAASETADHGRQGSVTA